MAVIRASALVLLVSLASGCSLVHRLPFGSPWEGPVAPVPPEAVPYGYFMQAQAAPGH